MQVFLENDDSVEGDFPPGSLQLQMVKQTNEFNERRGVIMKRLVGLMVTCLFLVPVGLWADEQGKKAGELKTFQEKLSYSMGLDVGTYFKGIGDEINFESPASRALRMPSRATRNS